MTQEPETVSRAREDSLKSASVENKTKLSEKEWMALEKISRVRPAMTRRESATKDIQSRFKVVIQNDDENDMESHEEADEEPRKLERVTDGGHSSKAFSSLEDRLTTQIQQGLAQAVQQGLAQAVLQLKEFIMHNQREHRATAAGSSGSQSEGRELTVTSHEQPLGIKDSCSDNGSSGSVLETNNRNNGASTARFDSFQRSAGGDALPGADCGSINTSKGICGSLDKEHTTHRSLY